MITRLLMTALWLALITLTSPLLAAKPSDDTTHAEAEADSVMAQVMHYARSFEGYIRAYQGEVYIKGNSQITQKNFLYRGIPWAFPFKHSHEGDLFELHCNVRFEAPNHMTLSPEAMRSSHKKSISSLVDISPLLNLNIYSATSFDGRFIMPGSPESKGIYYYRLDSTYQEGKEEILKIRFLPRRKNLNLISGWLYVARRSPIIRGIDAEGVLDIAKFHLQTRFGHSYEECMLPVNTCIELTYNVLNNISVSTYECDFRYQSISIDRTGGLKEHERQLDRSNYFAIDKRSVPVVNDSSYWARLRGRALSSDERQIYLNQRDADSLRARTAVADTTSRFNYIRLGERMVTTRSFWKNDDGTSFSYSGVLNPSMVGYSKRNGVMIRQRLMWNRSLHGDKLLNMMPEVGIGFRHKQLFYRFDTNWLYAPSRMGRLSASLYNGTNGFSSKFIDVVNAALDSVNVNFDNLFINYYRDNVIRLENDIELTNGLTLATGLYYNRHRLVRQQGSAQATRIAVATDEAVVSKQTYVDFAPFIRLTWTPLQYYRMEGRRKVHLDSPTPTLSMEYAQGLSGVLGADSRFSRLEFDLHQSVALPQLRSISYRVGVGGFFNQRSEYFVDYRYFRPNNYPATWNDHLGGVFNLLGTEWFCASPEYVQVHFMYESPYILLHLFKRISRFILSERLYAGQLFTRQKPYYTEVGYGLGNYICNVGIFTSFQQGRAFETGLRVSLEIGKYW